MATAGFSVGLGNVWRFPFVVGENGGGAFILVYLFFALAFGIPVLTAEVTLGRRAGLTPIAGWAKLTGKAWSPWNLIGWFGIAAGLVIMSFYVMVVAWIVGYFVMAVTGSLPITADASRSTFEAFIGDPVRVIVTTAAVIAMVGAIVGRGLNAGFERLARWGMPTLLGLLLVLAVRSITLPGAGRGLAWYLAPNFAALDGDAVLAALGQAFFSIGVGASVAFGLAAYLDRDSSDAPGNSALVVACDTGVAIVAGLAIFPALFAFGLEPGEGPGLLFVTIPQLFHAMPGGYVFGPLFFLMMVVAGLTTAIAQVDVLAMTLTDSLGVRKRRAAWLVAGVIFALNVPLILSQGPWRDVRVGGADLFSIADAAAADFMIPIGGFLMTVYVAWVWGFDRLRDEANVGASWFRVNALWRPWIRYLIPAALALVLVAGIL